MTARLNSLHIDRAARVLRDGGVIAYATEGVWGLGCDPFSERAVQRILELKGRRVDKGLILVAASIAQLAPLLARLPGATRERLLQSWPGPISWVVPTHDEMPRWITGQHDSVAVRVSAHPQVRSLCAAFDAPIVSTSANRRGRTPARDAFAVRKYFGARIDYLLPGTVGDRRRPSQIRDARTGRILRA